MGGVGVVVDLVRSSTVGVQVNECGFGYASVNMFTTVINEEGSVPAPD